MSLRTTLERERERYALPPDAFERLVDERRRRTRRHRSITTVAAIALGVLAVATAIAAFRGAGRSIPAEERTPRITPQNVGSLRVLWRAPLTHRAGAVAIADGIVVAITDPEDLPKGTPPRVTAYPLDCSDRSACGPLWSAEIRTPGLQPAGPLVRGGLVYVAGDGLTAFPLHCATGGAVCDPLWHAPVPGGATQPVANADTVFVGSGAGRVYAFPLDCAAPQGVCSPTWVSSPEGLPLLASDVVDDRVLVSVAASEDIPHLNRLYTYEADCSTPCRPAKVDQIPGQRFASMPVVSGDVAYVGTAVDGGEGSLQAFDVSCGLAPSCRLWSLEEHEALNIPRPVVGNGVVVTAARFATNRIRAYAAGPSRPDGPRWTACCVMDISDALPVIVDGLIYVPSLASGISVYPVECATGPLCRPAWTWSGEPPIGSPGAVAIAVGDGVLVAAERSKGLFAFAPQPSGPELSSRDRANAAAFYSALALGAVALLLVRRRRRLG